MRALQSLGVGNQSASMQSSMQPAMQAMQSASPILSDKNVPSGMPSGTGAQIVGDGEDPQEEQAKTQAGFLSADMHCETCKHQDGEQCSKYGWLVADEDGCKEGYEPLDSGMESMINEQHEASETPDEEMMEHAETGSEEEETE